MGGCSFSKLKQKKLSKIRKQSRDHTNEPRRKSQQGYESRLASTAVPRHLSIVLVYPHEDDLIRQITSTAKTLGHRVISIVMEFQVINEWIKRHKSYVTGSQPNVDSLATFAPKIHEVLGNEASLPLLELVIVDRRLPAYHAVADSICEYIRHHLTSGFDAIIVALLSSARSSTPSDVLDSGIIQCGFSRLLYQSDLVSNAEVCQELLMFQCHDIALLRRLRQLSGKYGSYAGQSVSRYGSNGHLTSFESRGSAPLLSRMSSTGQQTPPNTGMDSSSQSLISNQITVPSPSLVKNYVNKGRSASISGSLVESGTIPQSALMNQQTADSLASAAPLGLMEPIVELDEATNAKEKEEQGVVSTKCGPDKQPNSRMRRFSFDPSNLISSMTNKLGISSTNHSRMYSTLTRSDIDRMDPTLLNEWASSVIVEREMKLKQCQSYRRAKRSSKLSSANVGNELQEKRKDSWARVSSFNVDSPLSQVVQLINSAQARSSSPVAKDLQKALELMFSNDLFSGLLKTSSPNFDQTTADLIGGLMTNLKHEEKEVRQSVVSGKHRDKPALTDVSNAPPEIETCLRNDDSWSYDVLALERITQKKPLVYLAMRIFQKFNVMQFLKCSDQVMANWLQVIEEHYRPSNHYHNSTHAADVMQTSSVFLLKDNIREVLGPMDEVAMLLAAVIHDVDHPGRTNPFLVNSGHDLAILYNDLAVLESHHAALGFQLSKDEKVNIFKNLPAEEYRNLRKQIIDLVLATEMARHFEHVTKFVNNLSKPMMVKPADDDDSSSGHSLRHVKRCSIGSSSSNSTVEDSNSFSRPEGYKVVSLASLVQESPENRAILKRMLIKCCDVNNPTRPLELCKEWAIRIAEEYFAQTDDEKRLGLPLVMPTFDRQTCNIAKSQTSFIDFFLKDMFAAWDVVCDCPEILANLDSNYKYWNGMIKKETPAKSTS